MENPTSHNIFQKAALATVIVGAVISLILVIDAGQNNKSIILRLLFMGWVLSPFVAFVAANVSKRWVFKVRAVVLYWLTIIIAVASPVIYSGVLSPPGAKLTPLFLFVPLFAWTIITIFIVAVSKSRR
ncbi:MAG: hypothetical protein ABI367_09390 [Mucilaginibacter sp.]